MKKKIAPSILSADFSNLGQQIRMVEMAGADMIHCDVMDGQFVPNLTFGPMVVSAVNKITNMPLDVHLMINTPENIVESFRDAGADFITVHQEAVIHLDRLIHRIKSLGCKAGVSINPSTPVSSLDEVLEIADLILIMSVNPGFGGQKFIANSLRKIEYLSSKKIKQNLTYEIEIDGGITLDTIKQASDAGCEVFVAGSAIFHKENIPEAILQLKKLIE